MKIEFTKYLHDNSSAAENVEELTASGLSEADADLVAVSRPWYEIGLTYEFDTETKQLSFVRFERT